MRRALWDFPEVVTAGIGQIADRVALAAVKDPLLGGKQRFPYPDEEGVPPVPPAKTPNAAAAPRPPASSAPRPPSAAASAGARGSQGAERGPLSAGTAKTVANGQAITANADAGTKNARLAAVEKK